MQRGEGAVLEVQGPSASERIFAILLGILMSLTLSGYQVGKSNHTVYLLEAYRQLDPRLLANDWFTNGTLQYHGFFAILTRYCLQWGIFQPVFLIGYLLTVVVFHWGIWRLVRAIGGSTGAYLLAVVFLHLSAGGTGLGGFQFLQDAAFLPSNISNVAMLVGTVMAMEGRIWKSAIWLAIAGISHINFAAFAPLVFVVGALAQPGVRQRWPRLILPAVLVALASGANIIPALIHLEHDPSKAMPLDEYVAMYARLRHPHHYYPRAWPLVAYVASLWSLVPAGIVLWKAAGRIPLTARRVLFAVGGFLIAANLFALTFAGIVFISERLVQLAVFRFSIYFILMACALAAWGLVDGVFWSRSRGPLAFAGAAAVLLAGYIVAASGNVGETARHFVDARPAPLFLTLGLVVVAGIFAYLRDRLPAERTALIFRIGAVGVIWLGVIAWGRWLGLNYIPEDPPEYLHLAEWARNPAHTPIDAMFLVPPEEQAWRLASLRSIVINFKAIPQTSAEMPEWRRRMQDVTGVQDLSSLAGSFTETLKRLEKIYTARPESELIEVARKYGCRYIVIKADLPGLKRVGPTDGTGDYRLYDLGASIR